jgi:hypothetical protein
MGITLGAFFDHKTVTARAAAIIIIGHIPSPFINGLTGCVTELLIG